MEGQGQGDLKPFLRQPADLRHQAAGGDREVALADIEPFLVGDQADKPHQVVVVVHGFAGPHHHHV